jgi:hypothetical protein
MITGSYLLGSLFPEVTVRTAQYIEFITMIFLPAIWLSVTYFSNVVILPKIVVTYSCIYALSACVVLFAVSPSMLAHFYLPVEIVWLAVAGYIILKSLEAVIVKHLSRPAAGLLLSGVAILTFCSALNLFQYVFTGKGPLDYLPIGLIMYTLLWDYSYTYQYDVLLKDRLKVLEDLNAANENGRLLELKYLRSQIRPHFINNVLNTIIAVSLTDPEGSRELLCHFSTYLKSCYDFGEPYNSVAIEHELSVVKAYVALQEARHAGCLHVEYMIDDISVDIPPLILQPLVENAIKHNKISINSPLSVSIYVTQDGESLKLGVGDNGQGFDQEAIPVLLNGEPNGRGVGIYNVNMRLQRTYGTSLKIENRKGGGCDVYMVIPNKSGYSSSNDFERQGRCV